MKTVVRGAIRDEKGQVLILALVLLVVGGLILTPLLGLMSTGLVSGQVYEKKTDELYAADAGVEDAIWKIQNRVPSEYPYEYPKPGKALTVNGKDVEVVIGRHKIGRISPCYIEYMYQILSTAIGADGTSTTVEAYLSVLYSYMDFSPLLDYALISQNTIGIQPNNYVDGDVWLPDKDDLYNKGAISGTVYDSNDVLITWPTADQLRGYYLEDVGGAPDCGPSIDIKNTNIIGPCYREGSLSVDNTGNSATLVLEGTVYVTGNLEFLQPGASKSYTVDLNGQTIFVEGSISFPSNHVSICGSGCIIAVGYINFQPGIASDEDDFVLVMSITDEVNFQPSGDFTGCVAGNVKVQLQPNNKIEWIDPEGKDLNFPMGEDENQNVDVLPMSELNIESWEIK